MVPKWTQGALWGANLAIGGGIVAVAVFNFVLAKPAYPALSNPTDRPVVSADRTESGTNISAAAGAGRFEWPEKAEVVAPTIVLGDYFKILSIRTGANPPRDPSADITIEGKRFPNQALVSINGPVRLALAPDGAPDPALMKWKLNEVYSDRVVFGDGKETQEVRKGDGLGGVNIGDLNADLQKYFNTPWKADFEGSKSLSNVPGRKGFLIGLEEQKWLAANEQLVLERDIKLSPSQDGLKVESVMPGSVAEGRGFATGDIIESINSQQVRSKEDMDKLKQSMKTQSSFSIVVNRMGQRVVVFFTMAAPTPGPTPGPNSDKQNP